MTVVRSRRLASRCDSIRKRCRVFKPIVITCKRPLLPGVIACAAIAGTDVRRIEQAIVSGQLQFCFDLRRSGATKRCVRVSVASLQAFIDGKPKRFEEPQELSAVLSDWFPSYAETITACSFARVVAVDPSHAQGLVRDGLLVCTQPAAQNSSARITRRSAIELLHERRIL